MVTVEELEGRRNLASQGDLADLLNRLTDRARPLLARTIPIPTTKATLSIHGGVCPVCRIPLAFDPWSPSEHQCPRCHGIARGTLHDGHWARAQHLWLAERAAHLATVGVIRDDESFGIKGRELLRHYYQLYFDLPNKDNVLGPSRLFFSTYLESIWVVSYLAAAFLLRERGWLDQADVEAINAIADEAATLIGEFNEGMSNRQTWNSAALTAIAAWFGDEELAETAIESRTGLLGHLTDGFDDDGMWTEGENYHLFALRGLLMGLGWARVCGVDLLADPLLAKQLSQALLAPAKTALPDFTFPARKDSRYGVSLAHPAYLECFENGLACLGDEDTDALAGWLGRLYQCPSISAQTYDAYLHDAGEPDRAQTTRADLSWWMLLTMKPALPKVEEPFQPSSALLAAQGTAILRSGGQYLSIECGAYGGDHGHPDRLGITVHAGGVPWLLDPGTGSYLTRDLFWYRSTLAHNAPRCDGVSQAPGAARCLAFEERGDWGWIAAEFGELKRTVVQGACWVVDLLELRDGKSHRLELPWHLTGEVAIETAGRWEPDQLEDEFTSLVERFIPRDPADVVLRATAQGQTLRVHLVGGTVVRATGPGRPGEPPQVFHLVRIDGIDCRLVAVLDFEGTVTRVEVGPGQVVVTENTGATTIRLTGSEATVSAAGKTIQLAGAIPVRPPARPMLADRPIRSEGEALRIEQVPRLDGSFDGFDGGSPLVLEDETHYYRSEEPYQGLEAFSATGYVNWDSHSVYLAIEVSKPDVVLGDPIPTPLELDNEPDDIHLDGVQVYYRISDGPPRGFLIRPVEDGSLAARPIPGSPNEPAALQGAATVTDTGYRLTVALPCPELDHLPEGATLAFDILVNEAQPGRVRRAGQLAWGGGNGWVYLRGDRRPESQWGALELIP